MRASPQFFRSAGIIVLGIAIIIALVNFFGLFKFAQGTIMPLERFIQKPPVLTDSERSLLLQEVASLRMVQEENEELRKMIDFFETVEYEFEVANVVSRDPVSLSLIYIDKGERDGVVIDQPVVTAEGIIIGKVLKTSLDSAQVQLFVANSARLAVKTPGSAGTTGVLKGYLGDSMRMDQILNESAIQIGDVVVTSGLEPRIPAGLVVGSVVSILNEEGELLRSADIQPATNLNELSLVSVIKTL